MVLTVDDDIVLETVDLKDAQKRYEIIIENKGYLRQWLGWLDFYNCVDDVINYTKLCQQRIEKKEAYIFSIYYKNEYVGCIEIQNIDHRNKKCEIGYWIAQNASGKGIMIRSCQRVIEYIFNEIGLNKINIFTATKNFKSQAIPQKLGFVKEGTLEDNECLYGNFVDNFVFGLTKENWTKIGN